MPEFADEAEGPHEAKRETRITLLAHRRALTGAQRADAAARVQAELVALVRRLRPTRMTGYVPVGSEPGGADLPAVLRAVLAPEAELLLPVLRDDLDLDWAVYTDSASLVAAGRGLREPAGPRLGRSAVVDAQLVVVPALAVDHRGLRLGRGGGSYDRALARVPVSTVTVALLHDGELVAQVPAQPHDRPVRAVITPAGGLRTLAEAPGVGPPASAGRSRVG
ncbi:5-formyltetrahydrofolate cyclo-ligase [Micromonospora coerulea]|uniref:5-formyltetrahydrofolate cyclo-ligase n=1 Tax=Micromonospora coerulea TaxID=47856 RepID=UPI001907B5D2|nr:5-formyltetrahydrofolate cyclo-ligase [Micromonospora veneta]